ncbi:MAG: hypothetical protein RLY31_1320 [Bacteroidota bacterium]|jgi:hypothetical protein
MVRLSSNFTLLLKIFFPTFYVTFFGAFTIAVWRLDAPTIGPLAAWQFNLLFTLLYTVGLAVIHRTVFRLKRIEADESHLFVSNYFKTYRYPLADIEQLSERNLGIFQVVSVRLKAAGHFGRRLFFLLDMAMLRDYLQRFPDSAAVFRRLLRSA